MPLAAPKIEYRPRRPENGVLHRVVGDHLEEFHSAVIDGVFVEEEDNSLKFCRLRAPMPEEIIDVTKDFRKRAVKMLARE